MDASFYSTLSQLQQFYFDRLFSDCLPFWLRHSVDREYGGFITSLNKDGTVLDTDKSAWQQGRFTWLLGELFNEPELYRMPERENWLEVATHGAKFMTDHGFDADDGRMWFQLDRKGQPLRKRRYSYSESFAAIAFGELFKAVDQGKFKDLAIACLKEFVGRSNDLPKHESKFTEHRMTRSLGVPMISIVTAQELRDSVGLEEANSIIDQSIESILADFVDADRECVWENVGLSGNHLDHFDGRTLNPGHAIEAAWFIMDEGRHRQKKAWIETGCKMLDWMFRRGWDGENGGLLYFVDVNELPVQEYWHDMKFWWPHCEALIASLLAFEVTGNPHYFELHQTIHRWSFDHFHDSVHGEWYGYLHRDGSLSSTMKGNHWKGPFHYPRMLLFCYRILGRLLSQHAK